MSYTEAQESFAARGVDTEEALAVLAANPISVHCWQGDDVQGFEGAADALGGGLAVTGNYPGRARTVEELQADLDKAFDLIPGPQRLNLHAIYGDFSGGQVDRDAISIEQFEGWVQWASERKLGIDFNPTCFGHKKAVDNLTLSHPDKGVRDFWIEHCQRTREIGAEMGRRLGTPCVNNIWIPDGMKDQTADRLGFRRRLLESLDALFDKDFGKSHLFDAVESKLFGIGSESFVVGSHEFYLGYAATRQKVLCLDAGHFHPTESIGEKISSVLLYVPRLLLHVSRGVRWDSDHVVIMDDPTQMIFDELVRCDALRRTSIGLDFFDASINRIAAWVIGTRAAQKCLLRSLLSPVAKLKEAEQAFDFTRRLALFEDAKSLPWGKVWAEFCRRQDAPEDGAWLERVKAYEAGLER